MEIRTRHIQEVALVEIEGRIDANTAAEIEKELNILQEENRSKIIVDFSNVHYISSAGLRVFLTALKWARSQNGDLKLASLEKNVEKIFKLAGFTKIFNIASDLDAALAAFDATIA